MTKIRLDDIRFQPSHMRVEKVEYSNSIANTIC